MQYEEIRDYLFNLKNYSVTYGIDRMQVLQKLINYPDKSFPVIHVAGSNGKGSVCFMLDAIFQASGYKTGLFTSPHLVDLEERIQVNRHYLSKLKLMHYFGLIKSLVINVQKEYQPSFFEYLNAIAFLFFKDEQVDIGIIETGLGGEKDSTNVVNPLVSVITSISEEHVEILGPTIKEIAQAKAGVIKQGVPVVIGLLPPEAEAVVRVRALSLQAPIYSVKELFGEAINNYPKTNAQGIHQRINAAIALTVVSVLKEQFHFISPEKALESVHIPGRWETIFFKEKKIILDCTHNAEGVPFLENNLVHLEEKPAIFFSSLSLRNAQAIAPILVKYASEIYLVPLASPRALSMDQLKALFQDLGFSRVHEVSLNDCDFSALPKLSVVTGSCYLVGEVMKLIALLRD